jgi:hypothetical protein
MDSRLQAMLAEAHAAELQRAASRARRHCGVPGDGDLLLAGTSPVTLRFAFPDDAEAIVRLAVLDSARAPRMPVLLAEVGGELRAALSLADGAAVADPFHPSVPLVELLRARARQLEGEMPRRRRRRIRLGMLAWR